MATAKAVRRSKADEDVKPRVWSARICPFAERVLFALGELQIDYEPVVISLDDKPPRLLEINPEGKVPTIEDLGEVLYESTICVEYLDESFKSPSGKRLFPEKPMERALWKIICDYIANKFVPKFYAILQASSEEETASCVSAMLRVIAEIDSKMRKLSPQGPFFAGADPTFLDIILMPHVRRFSVLEHYKGFTVPDTAEYSRFRAWRDACLKLPSYQRIKDNVSEAELNAAFRKYASP